MVDSHFVSGMKMFLLSIVATFSVCRNRDIFYFEFVYIGITHMALDVSDSESTKALSQFQTKRRKDNCPSCVICTPEKMIIIFICRHLLEPDVTRRATIKQVAQSPWLHSGPDRPEPGTPSSRFNPRIQVITAHWHTYPAPEEYYIQELGKQEGRGTCCVIVFRLGCGCIHLWVFFYVQRGDVERELKLS